MVVLGFKVVALGQKRSTFQDLGGFGFLGFEAILKVFCELWALNY